MMDEKPPDVPYLVESAFGLLRRIAQMDPNFLRAGRDSEYLSPVGVVTRSDDPQPI